MYVVVALNLIEYFDFLGSFGNCNTECGPHCNHRIGAQKGTSCRTTWAERRRVPG